MYLLRHGPPNQERPGILIDGRRKDLSGSPFFDFDRRFFARGGLERLRAYLDERTAPLRDIADDVRVAPCIARPGLIVCIGLNYADHAAETGAEPPREPIIFAKPTNTIGGARDDIAVPRGATKTDYECELGVVLARDVHYLADEGEARAAIAGYCVVNDVSERTAQLERGGQWIKGKASPGFTPAGPYLVTPDELGDPDDLRLRLSVNGAVRQDGSTRAMIFRPASLVHYLSQFMRLEAGDLISTGTPAGVALGMGDPAAYLKPGDLVELSVEGLGTQRQRFV